MQVASGWRRSAVVLTALLVVLAGGVSVTAQDNPIHRFFSFSGDITIDGEPLLPGAEIVAVQDGNEIGRATVNPAGAWIMDIDAALLDGGPCDVTFIIEGLQTDQDWDTCSLRVRLTLFSPPGSTDSGSGRETSPGRSGGGSASGGENEQHADGAVAADPNDTDPNDTLGDSDEGDSQSSQGQQIVRPAAPRTGTGGVLASEGSTNWPRAAAITALLTLAIASVALLMSRRTDSAT